MADFNELGSIEGSYIIVVKDGSNYKMDSEAMKYEFNKMVEFTNISAYSYTAALSNIGTIIRKYHTSSHVLVIPPINTVAWPEKAYITIRNIGVGDLTITPGAGVTFNNITGRDVLGKWETAQILRVLDNNWDII